MPEISKITLPSGTTYDIKDAYAREIAGGGVHFKGVTTTEIADLSTVTTYVIDGVSYTVENGDMVIYNKAEFVYATSDLKWHELGDNSAFKALAYKDTASTTYTPSGDVSKPSFTGLQASLSVSGTPEGTVSQPTFTGNSLTSTGSYTPDGEVSTPAITVKTAGSTTTVNSITDVGTLPTLSTTVANENLTISFNTGTLPTKGEDMIVKTGDAEYESSKPSFTGIQATLNVTGTPEGTVSQPTFTGTSLTSTGTYTPVGDVSKPVFTGDTATITVS